MVTTRTSLWVKADGTDQDVRPKGERWTLTEMQEKVGGYIEVVPDTNLPAGQLMVANEEGLLLGLPLNRKATMMAGRPIVGDVLIIPTEQMR